MHFLLQGKEEFERHQRELLEKENIIKHGKPQLEQHQVSSFPFLFIDRYF